MSTAVPPAGPDGAPPVVRRVALVYNERTAPTLPAARRAAEVIKATGREVWLVSAWEEKCDRYLEGADLAVTFGGDGTILRTARIAAPRGVPILGVNLGRLGFLTEIAPEDVERRLPDYLEGNCFIEHRDMLGLTLEGLSQAVQPVEADGLAEQYYALNDVVIGRGERARVILLSITVDGAQLATIRADGIVIATPTGSTAYTLSAGGPIIHPYVGAIVLTPIMPHLSFLRSLVIPATAAVSVQVFTDHSAMCSVDGQIDIRLNDGATANVRIAPFPCRFLRARASTYFYESLLDRLKEC